jgi:hypothetical protein
MELVRNPGQEAANKMKAVYSLFIIVTPDTFRLIRLSDVVLGAKGAGHIFVILLSNIQHVATHLFL